MGIGTGLGSFMDGLMKGAQVSNQLESSQREQDRADKRLDIETTRDKRQADADALKLKKDGADFDYQQQERAANAPILAGQRKSVLQSLQDQQDMRETLSGGMKQAQQDYDAEKAKSITATPGADGKTVLAVDGQQVASADEAEKLFQQRHGSFMDHFRQSYLPKVQQMYLSRGDAANADAWQKWGQNQKIQGGMEAYGRLEGRAQMGDWSGVADEFNSLSQNKDYNPFHGHQAKATVLKDDKGNAVGIHVEYQDPSGGAKFARDFKDMAEFHQLAAQYNPQQIFEQTKTQVEATQAAKVKMAEKNNEVAGQIAVERAKSDGQIDQERVKTALKTAGGDPDTAKGVLDTYDKIKDPVSGKVTAKDPATGKDVELSVEEGMRKASEIYHSVRLRGVTGGAPAVPAPAGGAAAPAKTVPAPRLLMSRPGAAAIGARTPAPAAAPPAKAKTPAADEEE